ncbi:VCBS repeat-containing protein [Streptomyces zhihengii]|uniref:VCBS repeat-containing protein n=1 Tax=Streptomyces zhihengii TaxID=1818004 RepID=UPI0033BAEDEE
MDNARTRTHRPGAGRRLTALAVTAVLTATGGTLAAMPAAAASTGTTGTVIASTPAGTADAPAQEAAVRFPLDAEIVSAGTTGFLSRTNSATPEYRWTRWADGTSTVLPAAASVSGSVSDVVVTGDDEDIRLSRVLRIHDMAAPPAAPVEADFGGLGTDWWFAGAVGSTLVVMVEVPEGGWAPHLVTVGADGTLTDRAVTGMPPGVCELNATAHTAHTAVFDCGLGLDEVRGKVVVDLATASAVSRHVQAGKPWRMFEAAVSDTHVAWPEEDGTTRTIHVARHGTGERRQLPAEAVRGDDFRMLGEWVTLGQPRTLEWSAGAYDGEGYPIPPRPFTAVSAKTGETVPLLTHVSSSAPAPDGSLLVRGGLPETGEGLYRVTLGADGKPVAAMVAPTGRPTAVTLLGSDVPDVVTGEQLAGGVDLSWDLSRGDVYMWATLVHVRTGQRVTWPLVDDGGTPDRRTVGMRWDVRELTRPGATRPAPGGEYTWEIRVRPDDGIGPELRATGAFTVTRPAVPRDYDDNGTPEVLLRDHEGVLRRVGTQPVTAGDNLFHEGAWTVGGGWQVYDRMESAGDVAGTPVGDVIARDRSGVLWLYEGTGIDTKPFRGRTKVGGGWGIYDRLAGGSDLTGDGRADVVATDMSGGLWLYSGTGDVQAPFAARKRIGGGWGIYNRITAVGNLAGAAAGDLVARDASGVLWLHLGKGDGTFAARTRIGAGWNTYGDLVGVGDANGDGRPDLLALKQGEHTGSGSYFYAGTGDRLAPFRAAKANDVLRGDSGYESGF